MDRILAVSFLFSFSLSLALINTWGKERFIFLNRLKRIAIKSAEAKYYEEDELNKPFVERVVRPIFTGCSGAISRFMPQRNREKLQHVLQLAGYPGNLQPHEFQALHYGIMILLAAGGALLSALSGGSFLKQIILGLTGGTVGYLLGKVYLSSKIKKRYSSIQKELPDVLDLLTVSVEAGLGFDAALLRVVEKSEGELSRELGKTLQEMQMGKGRRDAMRDLGQRTEVDDLLAFISAIIQADQLGVSISKVIRVQAEQVRLKRRQRIEEKAMKAPIKMLLPLVFFIFPSIFIVLLGPAALKILETFTSN